MLFLYEILINKKQNLRAKKLHFYENERKIEFCRSARKLSKYKYKDNLKAGVIIVLVDIDLYIVYLLLIICCLISNQIGWVTIGIFVKLIYEEIVDN